ncbi:MAG TPA: heme exporter protein CcmD [Marinospirillum sp.]|uniref:heme exporter protein CcmD n=1 Tax=Marinospirillum sp. TaxID=2183934 RepID=UPI002B46C813|nr:heme exporter protein CcmD [Marinospirillum sp.]HKM16410.1 heme exporter protein CcmD [Marinospirillum sp.]
MYFDSLSEFFNMGGHGLYVWSCYAISLVLMAASILLPWLKLKSTRKQLARQFAREATNSERDIKI